MKLKIFIISQNVNTGYDTYDSAVVIAKDEAEAKRIHPSDEGIVKGVFYDEEKHQFWNTYRDSKRTYLFEVEHGSWANELTKIKAEFIGYAKDGSKKGVVVASFNAG